MCCGLITMRCCICWMLFGALTITMCLRTFISMSIVMMVRPQGSIHLEDDDYLEWPNNSKGLVLIMPFAGALISLPFYMKFLADRRSPKVIILVVVLFQSLLSFISPITAKLSFIAFLVIRFFIGVAEGCVMSSLNSIAGHWFPSTERSFKVAAYTCGFQISFGVATYFVSFLSTIGLTWEYAFYIFGVLGILFLIPWFFFVTDTPNQNRFISKEEEHYLFGVIRHPTKNRTPAPWKDMFTSSVIYTHILCMIGFYFAIGVTSNFLPMYFDSELNVSVSRSGWYTLLPFVAQIGSKLLAGMLADIGIEKGIVTPTTTTKINQSIGAFGSAAALIALPLCRSSFLVIAVLTLYGLTFACCACGFYTSMTLIAPRFTGSVSAQITLVGVIANLMPTATYLILNSFDISSKFIILFAISAALQVLSGIVYLIWGTAQEQSWAKLPAVPLTVLGDKIVQ